MKLNVKRKVREITLNSSEFLLPLYEVIVNAIHAIEERKLVDDIKGQIKVTIVRDKTQSKMKLENVSNNHPITSFIVEDNGVGFNSETFQAFNDAYTEHKLKKGGKGVGRFTVLRAFSKMNIESTYCEDGKILSRNFEFDIENEVSELNKPYEVESEKRGSVVYLDSYFPEFFKKTEIDIEAVAEKIVDHCLIYYLTGSIPEVILIDEDKTILLDDIFDRYIYDKDTDTITVEDKEFDIFYVKKITHRGNHQIHYCAHNRLVESIPIKTLIPNLCKPIGLNGSRYNICAFVTGEYLNENLNEVRNSFTIPSKIKDRESDLYNNLSLEEITDGVKESIWKNNEGIISEIENKKLEKINEYILGEVGIEYRHLIECADSFSTISPENLSNDKLEKELHRINYELEKEHRLEVKELLDKSVDNFEEYSEELNKILVDEDRFSKSKLANYVVRRKVILQVFEKLVRWQDDGKYKEEKDLHNIIFPMGGESDTIPFNSHNLWLLDERLTFNTYVASDKKVGSMKPISSKSGKEPDLTIFNKKWAYSEGEDFSSISVFEFKRPGRYMASKLDTQVKNYFKELMKGKAKDYKGNLIDIEKTTPKFGYLICEVDKTLKDDLTTWHNYYSTPNGTLYSYWSELNLYIEIISFKQLLKGARERHRAFFKMLGIE